jgi:hypothetical protein
MALVVRIEGGLCIHQIIRVTYEQQHVHKTMALFISVYLTDFVHDKGIYLGAVHKLVRFATDHDRNLQTLP